MKKKLPLIILIACATSLALSAALGTVRNWNCKKCGTVIQAADKPSSMGCPAGSFHTWYDLGETGQTTYQCQNCAIQVKSSRQPASIGCPEADFHRWRKL